MQHVDSTYLFSKTIRIYENRPQFQIVIKKHLNYYSNGDSVNVQLSVLTKDKLPLEGVPVNIAMIEGKKKHENSMGRKSQKIMLQA